MRCEYIWLGSVGNHRTTAGTYTHNRPWLHIIQSSHLPPSPHLHHPSPLPLALPTEARITVVAYIKKLFIYPVHMFLHIFTRNFIRVFFLFSQNVLVQWSCLKYPVHKKLFYCPNMFSVTIYLIPFANLNNISYSLHFRPFIVFG